MARVKDLWFSEVPDPDDPEKKIKKKTAKHPDNGGSKDAKRWLACWITPDDKEATKAFRIQDAAKKYARQKEEEVARDEYIDPKASGVYVKDLAPKWLRMARRPRGERRSHRKMGATSWPLAERAVRLRVVPKFGERKVRSIRASEVEEYISELSEKFSPSLVAAVLSALQGIFDIAVADGLMKDNPARSTIVTSPSRDRPERAVWSADRARAVIDAHPVRYRVLPALMGGCGLREGEAFAIALEDIDFEAGTVAVVRQLARVNGLGWVFKLPKHGKTRTAHLPMGVAALVKAHIEAFPPEAYSLPWVGEDGRRASADHVCHPLVMWESKDARTNGHPVRPGNYDPKIWKPALGAAGVIEIPEGVRGGTHGLWKQERDDSTHALRHFCSTTLQEANVPIGGVMDILGHSKKGMPTTISTYHHTTAATYAQARKAIDRTLFRLRAVQDRRAGGTGTERAV